MESVCIHRVYALSELNLAKKCKGITSPGTEQTVRKQEVPMLWFNFILGSNYISHTPLVAMPSRPPQQKQLPALQSHDLYPGSQRCVRKTFST